MPLSSPVSPRDLGLKEKQFQSFEQVEAAFNLMVKRLNNVYKYNRRDHDRLTEDVEDVSGGSASQGCRVYLTSNQAIADANEHTVELDNESYDPDSIFDTGTFTVTIPETGHYLIVQKISFGSTSGGKTHKVIIAVNGGVFSSHLTYSEAGTTSHQVVFSDILALSANEEITMKASSSDGSYNIVGGVNSTFMALRRLI